MKKMAIFTLVLCTVFFTACDKNKDDSGIDIATLPAAITSYVNTNYTGYTIEEAQKDTLCSGMAGIEIELEKRNSEDITLFFSNENAYILKEEDLKYSALPANVQAFFSTNYPNYELPKEAEKTTLANGTTQFEVDLKEKTTKIEKEVTTNFEGSLKVCER
jgi:hypothetical protein